ncbi:preprotein translocase subunit SecG [Mucilaginibacter gracilis]|uniref:Protein-export membrane protein SecG n=1 Tax=Mucilaginibacter gracilis TaxID=423350 RepID=A0A495JB90_9SPHI|nr:preprotein translocase subunit SecG [Mucilaginibacter gracilis]RKR85632.1 preprotein translocase subunit SecG [Mucilaginibacter gracilis]
MLLLVIVAIIVCVLLGLIVLIQNPKGGGLSSNFSSSSQLLGVQKTGDILEKGTWILAVALIVLSLTINVVGKTGAGKVENVNQEQIDKASKPSVPVNSAPASLPDLNKKTK